MDARRKPDRTGPALAAGVAAGSAVTYFLDPARGRRRRALVRDKLVHAVHETADEGQAVARDARQRAKGLGHRLTQPLRRGSTTAPQREERVRAELGRWCSHPSAIDVHARNGTVTLAGPVLRDEADAVRQAVARIPGVESVEDRLRVYENPNDIPDFQGDNGGRGQAGRRRPEYLQEVWSPAARLLALLAGGASTAWGVRQRGPVGWAAAATGATVAARAWTNQPMTNLTGVGAGRGAVTVGKTITISAPADEVYRLWRRPESFPQFMRNVKEVRQDTGGRTHWKVRGPAGTTVSFDADVTEDEPNRTIAWATPPGSVIQHVGRVQFEAQGEDSTRVHVRMAYNPALGFAGHALAKLVGRDPKTQIDEDLLRLQTYLETGVRPHDAAAKQPTTVA